ncbi:hypothetical protein LLB_2374 [Legionella longbeachae D-4968]|nr:hypothetical protein LLB_2374 [Legionella longbeachae D-4968]
MPFNLHYQVLLLNIVNFGCLILFLGDFIVRAFRCYFEKKAS